MGIFRKGIEHNEIAGIVLTGSLQIGADCTGLGDVIHSCRFVVLRSMK